MPIFPNHPDGTPNHPDSAAINAIVAAMDRELEPNKLSLASDLLVRAAAAGMMTQADLAEAETQAKAQASISSLEAIPNPDIKQQIKQAFDIAEVYERTLGFTPPSPADLASAGVDYAQFAQEIEQKAAKLNCDFEIAIAPDLDTEQLTRLYDQLTDDQTIPNNPLWKQGDGNGLWWQNKATAQAILSNSQNPISANPNAHIYTDANGVNWTISAIPTMEQSIDRGKTYTKHTQNTDQPLPTLASYLAAQVSRLIKGLTPLDEAGWTWLRDTNGSRALYACWAPVDGRLGVRSGEVGDSGLVLGVRPPVWG